MKVYNVVWTPNNSSSMVSGFLINSTRSKTFSTKEKADEFVGQLIAAANLIGTSVDPRVNESEID